MERKGGTKNEEAREEENEDEDEDEEPARGDGSRGAEADLNNLFIGVHGFHRGWFIFQPLIFLTKSQ